MTVGIVTRHGLLQTLLHCFWIESFVDERREEIKNLADSQGGKSCKVLVTIVACGVHSYRRAFVRATFILSVT